MEPSIAVQVYDRELKAAVKELPPGCSIETVRRALAREKITHGIRWEAINDAVARANATGLTLTNITVAVAEEAALSMHYGKTGPTFSGEEAETSRHNLAAVGKAICRNDASVTLVAGVFVKADETVLTLRISRERWNVYGEEIPASGNEMAVGEQPFYNRQSLVLKKTADGYQFIAKVTGYLVINESDAWDIVDPFFASADRLTLFCRMIPLIYGQESFIEKLTRIAPAAAADFTALNTIMADPHLQNIEVRKGRPPVAGRSGSITFLIAPNPGLPDQSLDRIDYRDTGRFRDVKEGTVIAEQIPTIQSIPGIDVFGEAIPAEKMEEIDFSCGDGIIKECTPDLIRFIAREHGILELSDHYVNVTPQLTIKGDVCGETGNILYSRTVVVNGTVCAGFRVACGDLTIRESIEDGADIVCSGQLLIGKGIFGERTRVTVAGDAKIGLIQGASLRVQGNCTIEEYAYHARIFCGGILHVNGKGLRSREKGCVIGGEVSGMKTLDLHSAGSTATLTTLSCGFDPEGFETYKETVTLEKTLKMKIIQLQKRLHVNPNEKILLLQRIQNAPAEQKEAFKQALQELRTTIALAEKAGASVALLARKTVAADLSRCRIMIRNQLIAPTLIVFVNTRKKIYRDAFHASFSLRDDEIIMHERFSADGNPQRDSLSRATERI